MSCYLGKWPTGYLILLTPLFAQLLAPPNAHAVRSGEIIPPEEFNTVGQVVVMSERFGARGIGTGTLIAPDLVITAAHVVDSAQSPHHIKFGLDGNPNQASVIAFRISSAYQSGKGNTPTPADDIALLRLDRKFPESLDYYPLLVDKPVESGQRVTAVGFGLDSSAKLNIRSRGTLKCHRVRSDGALVFASGDAKNQMTDSGDSGGPLLMRNGDSYQVAALVQGEFFFLQGEEDSEYDALDLGLFVPLHRHREWIKSMTAELYAYSIPSGRPRYIHRNQSDHRAMALTLDQVATLIRIDTPAEEIFDTLRTRGLCEPLDEQARQKLADAGAGKNLIEALHNLSEPVLTVEQVEALLLVDTPRSNLLQLIWKHGGVYGRRDTESERRLRRAGAEDELIRLIYRKY